MNTKLLKKYAWPDESGLSKLKERMEKLSMSARAFDRILRWLEQLPTWIIHPVSNDAEDKPPSCHHSYCQ